MYNIYSINIYKRGRVFRNTVDGNINVFLFNVISLNELIFDTFCIMLFAHVITSKLHVRDQNFKLQLGLLILFG